MEKISIQSYSPGDQAEIDVSSPGSIGEYFEVAVTYRALDRLARQVAAYFQSVLGLPQGTRVALMMPILLQYPVCLFGRLRAGDVVVNVNPMYMARELRHHLIDSGAQAMVVAQEQR